MTAAFGIRAELLDTIFPFHIGFDRNLVVTRTGARLNKCYPDVVAGTALLDHFRIRTPAVKPDLDVIAAQSFTVFFLESLHGGLRLKGQMLPIGDDARNMLFLCSPAIQDMAGLAALGLSLKDFPIHDSIVDFLLLLQTRTKTLTELRDFAERLKKEVAVRRQAEANLLKANEELEERVTARTRELWAANEVLSSEVAERRRAEEQLRLNNIELRARTDKLERKNQQISILNKMGDMLQACQSVDETYPVIADCVRSLYPESAGSLSIYDEITTLFTVRAAWGGAATAGTTFPRSDCWALRRAKPHIQSSDSQGVACLHLKGTEDNQHLCMPLMVRGDFMGSLHLRWPDCPDFEEETRQHLIATAAEHIGLAIANLKLRENLRIQSLRDPLTGLFNRRHMEDSFERELSRASRHQSSVGVIMLDVDHFKRFNDTWGHAVGDLLLRELGGVLQKHIRAEDIACRFGGEEFVLILPTADIQVARKRAEAIRHAVERSLVLDYQGKNVGPVTVSLGVATYPRCGVHWGKVLEAADAALYQSKRDGRNRVTCATGPATPDHASPRSAMDFKEAVKSHVFWRVALRWMINGHRKIDADKIGSDRECALGSWIHGEGALLRDLPGYADLVREHARFHQTAADVVRLVEAGKPQQATRMLEPDGAFTVASTGVVDALHVLESQTTSLEQPNAPACSLLKDEGHPMGTAADGPVEDQGGEERQ